MTQRKQIIYCEDQKRFRDEFTRRHKQYYDISTVDDTRDLVRAIEQLKRTPDLVLIDLYYPRVDDDTYEQKRVLAEKSLAKLDKQIDETNQAVLNAWEPGGLEVLKMIRKKYPPEKLRIAFYTQKGLVLLSDAELRDAKQMGVDWLIKKKLTARTEKVWLDQMMVTSVNKNTQTSIRVYQWGLAVSWLITGLLISKTFFGSDKFTDIAITVVIGVLGTLASFVVAPIIKKINP